MQEIDFLRELYNERILRYSEVNRRIRNKLKIHCITTWKRRYDTIRNEEVFLCWWLGIQIKTPCFSNVHITPYMRGLSNWVEGSRGRGIWALMYMFNVSVFGSQPPRLPPMINTLQYSHPLALYHKWPMQSRTQKWWHVFSYICLLKNCLQSWLLSRTYTLSLSLVDSLWGKLAAMLWGALKRACEVRSQSLWSTASEELRAASQVSEFTNWPSSTNQAFGWRSHSQLPDSQSPWSELVSSTTSTFPTLRHWVDNKYLLY